MRLVFASVAFPFSAKCIARSVRFALNLNLINIVSHNLYVIFAWIYVTVISKNNLVWAIIEKEKVSEKIRSLSAGKGVIDKCKGLWYYKLFMLNCISCPNIIHSWLIIKPSGRIFITELIYPGSTDAIWADGRPGLMLLFVT